MRLDAQAYVPVGQGGVPLDPADARVVSCAARLFLERGIANVKMTEIAEEAGVGVATIYRHFLTKTGVAVEVALFLWGCFGESLRSLMGSAPFAAMSGAQRLEALFGEYCSTYVYHADFVAFVDEFDHLLLAEEASAEALQRYGTLLDSFYAIFEDAYRLGLSDGSVTRRVDFPVFYRAVAHALMGVAAKLGRGEVIPSDDFSSDKGAAELSCIVGMAISALSAT